MNLHENIRRILREVRVPRSERVELYRDNNIIVVVPLTHRALKKYAHECQWCINSDLDEWEDYHQGKHAVIIQRSPKKPKIGIKYPIPSEIFTIEHYTDIDSIYDILGYRFSSNEERDEYMDDVTSNINNFATNIIYYSPSGSLYDQEDNYLPSYGYSISDIPNVTPEVIKIMDDYLQENEEMSIQENIRRILREEYTDKQKKLLTLASKVGFLATAKITGGISKLLNILGKDFLNNKNNKIMIIKEILVEHLEILGWQYIPLGDINEEPIVMSKENGIVKQIEHLYPEDVSVYSYEEDNYDNEMGDTYVFVLYYEDLPTDILDQVFYILTDFHTRNV